jgi:carboxyl-terminal processing protease
MVRTGLAVILALACTTACTGAPSSTDPGRSKASNGASAGPRSADEPPADPREERLSRAVFGLISTQHLLRQPLDDERSRRAFTRYVEALDPSKMFLLASDVAALEPKADAIDDELKAGRLELAHAGAALFQERRAVVEQLVADILAKPLDSSDEETVETDPEHLELAKDEDELRERWRQRLELEALERVALMEDLLAAAKKPKPKKPAKPAAAADGDADADADAATITGEIPPTLEGREAKARADLAKTYATRFRRLSTPSKLDAASTLINAVTSVFDPHTNYLPPSDKANFDIQLTGTLVGIGAQLREDDVYIKVVEIVPGGAAWRQGELEAGDLILSVAQEGKKAVDVANMRIDDVVQMIRGAKGTKVTLSIQKSNQVIKPLTIERDVVEIEEAYARGAVLQPKGTSRPLGYIYLPSFYGGQSGQRSAASDVARLLGELAARKVAGVIVDVRGNGGGLLDDARVMTGLLIDRGPVVQTRVAEGDVEVLGDDDAGVAFDGPVVVMVDQFSASASEILAGALQDYHRAVIVGTGPTHGKGTVQVMLDLDRMAPGDDPLGYLKLTVQQFFRVSGASTQWQGVVPDIALPNPTGHLETDERHLDDSIPWSSIDALAHVDWPTGYKLETLVARSQARQAKNAVLGRIARRTELLRSQRDATKMPLRRAAWVAERAKRRAALEALNPAETAKPKNMMVTPINYDGKAPASARPGSGKTDHRTDRWAEGLKKDPFLDEALAVLHDMQPASAPGHAAVAR